MSFSSVSVVKAHVSMASTQSFCIHRAVATAPSSVRIEGAIDRFRPDASASREDDVNDDASLDDFDTEEDGLVVGFVIHFLL